MQALYGYFTAVESLKEVKREELRATHALDPAKHDFADKALFEKRKQQAVELFNQNIHHEIVRSEDKAEEGVLQSVQDAIDDFHGQLRRESLSRKNEMMKEARQLFESYIKLLLLPIEIEQREKLEQEKEEKALLSREQNFYPFIGNETIQALKDFDELTREATSLHISWDVEQQEIKSWYRNQIRSADALKPYFSDNAEQATAQSVVMELFKKVVFKDEIITGYLEQKQLHWSENNAILKSMIVKTIKGLQEEGTLEFADLTKNGEEDFKFLERLFSDTLEQNDFLEELIQKRTKNWDVERIALTDRVILKLACVEMMNSPSIPVKVSINEAIEISKMYSTPKSKQFINGVLDVVSNELNSSGKIRKSGRGLIDNK